MQLQVQDLNFEWRLFKMLGFLIFRDGGLRSLIINPSTKLCFRKLSIQMVKFLSFSRILRTFFTKLCCYTPIGELYGVVLRSLIIRNVKLYNLYSKLQFRKISIQMVKFLSFSKILRAFFTKLMLYTIGELHGVAFPSENDLCYTPVKIIKTFLQGSSYYYVFPIKQNSGGFFKL